MAAPRQRLLTRSQLSLHFREHIDSQLYDESDEVAEGVAIYSLADPRDIRLVRYVGQSSAPRRRFMQHLNAARLWLPDETPWWIKSPQLRPLYEWIRELHEDEYRLPTMVIHRWVVSNPRQAERLHIEQCLTANLPLLNIESTWILAKAARRSTARTRKSKSTSGLED